MALSRTYLGAHWLSDTIGGLILGAGIAVIVWAPLAYRLARERTQPHPFVLQRRPPPDASTASPGPQDPAGRGPQDPAGPAGPQDPADPAGPRTRPVPPAPDPLTLPLPRRPCPAPAPP